MKRYAILRLTYPGMVTHEQQAVLRELVWVNRDRLDGEPCFKRTRVPVQALIDHFEGKWHS